MRIKRTHKEYGSGSGTEIFESDTFRVVLWNLSKGIRTTISCQLLPFSNIHFDGKHEINSDNKCMAQYTAAEVLQMIRYQKKLSHEEGMADKAAEIRKCLLINRY
jgi:hypothetical protein